MPIMETDRIIPVNPPRVNIIIKNLKIQIDIEV